MPRLRISAEAHPGVPGPFTREPPAPSIFAVSGFSLLQKSESVACERSSSHLHSLFEERSESAGWLLAGETQHLYTCARLQASGELK